MSGVGRRESSGGAGDDARGRGENSCTCHPPIGRDDATFGQQILGRLAPGLGTDEIDAQSTNGGLIERPQLGRGTSGWMTATPRASRPCARASSVQRLSVPYVDGVMTTARRVPSSAL